jgi:nucleoside-diphosphate-sugar epimerase
MRISILGTNGLLSSSIACFYENTDNEIFMYGLEKPLNSKYTEYTKINLLTSKLPYEILIESDMIIYAIGAGIQSNLHESFELIYNLNVNAPVNICNNLAKLGYKGVFITFGSYFEIGENDTKRKYSENDLINSQLIVPNDYSISKRMLTRFASSFHADFKYWHFILPTIYGEKENPHRLIPYTLNAIKNNSELSFTAGDQIRQYIYIDELPKIINKAFLFKLASGIYNVEGNEELTVKELVTKLFNLANKKMPKGVFNKTTRLDTGMKILLLEGTKLKDAIDYNPNICISDVFEKYYFN